MRHISGCRPSSAALPIHQWCHTIGIQIAPMISPHWAVGQMVSMQNAAFVEKNLILESIAHSRVLPQASNGANLMRLQWSRSSGIPAASKGCWDALLMASTWAAGSVVKVTTLRLSAPHQPAPLPTSPSRLTIGTPCAAWGCWDAMLTPFTCSAASVTTSHFTPCGAPVGHDLPTRMESVGFPTARAKAISGTPAASGARLAAGPMVSMLTAATVDQGLAGCMKALAALRILSFHRPPEG